LAADETLTFMEAGSTSKIAELRRQSSDPADTLHYYQLAKGFYDTLQDESQLTQTLLSESSLLIAPINASTATTPSLGLSESNGSKFPPAGLSAVGKRLRAPCLGLGQQHTGIC
jgi:hypothetical protein